LAFLAESQGHGKLPRGNLFDRVRAGIGNYYGNTESTPKEAFTLDDLCSFYPLIRHDSFDGARDWCACCFAFFGLLRINEYMNGNLQLQHVTAHDKGISVIIPFSKTSLLPAQVEMIKRDDLLCPHRAFSTYSSFLHTTFPSLNPVSPLFITQLVSGFTPMSDADFIARIRDLIKIVMPNKNPMSYAGHSFRRGGATTMKLNGVSDSIIQQHGRWKSDAYRQYFDQQSNIDVRLLATQGIRSTSSSTSSRN
jgi:hypothetical protein